MKFLELTALAVLTATPAAAQPSPTAAPAFRSALEGYQPFQDADVAPWKESNETVQRIGGWRAYAREAQGVAPPAAPAPPAAGKPPASAPPAASGGHRH